MFTRGCNYCRKKGQKNYKWFIGIYSLRFERQNFIFGEWTKVKRSNHRITKQLFSLNSKKWQMKNDKYNLNETLNGDKSFYHFIHNGSSSQIKYEKPIEWKKRVIITGDSVLNGIHEKRISKNHRVTVSNFQVPVQRFWRT